MWIYLIGVRINRDTVDGNTPFIDIFGRDKLNLARIQERPEHAQPAVWSISTVLDRMENNECTPIPFTANPTPELSPSIATPLGTHYPSLRMDGVYPSGKGGCQISVEPIP